MIIPVRPKLLLLLSGFAWITMVAQGYSNTLHNSSFEEGDTLADALLWHRMTGSSSTVLESANGWAIDDQTAWHGKRSLRGSGETPLIFNDEVWERLPSRKSPWVFSVYMKADRPGVQCTLATGVYWRHREDRVSTLVELDTEWRRYELVVADITSTNRRGGDLQGPVNFIITPQQDATIWVDALQWERGKQAKDYLAEGTASTWTDAPALIFASSLGKPREQSGNSSWEGTVPLRVYREGTGDKPLQPVTISVPFSKGKWNGEGNLTLINSSGNTVPVQSEILTRWPEDQSIQSLALFFTDKLSAGWQDYQLVIGESPQSQDSDHEFQWKLSQPTTAGLFWNSITTANGTPLLGPASLRAIGMDNTVYDSSFDPKAEWELERTGPIHNTIRVRGKLVSQTGKALLAFTARIHIWRDLPGIKLELSAINSRDEGSVPLRSLYWHVEKVSPAETLALPGENALLPAAATQLTNLYLPESNQYLLRLAHDKAVREVSGRQLLYLQINTTDRKLLLHAPEGWQRHPAAIAYADNQLRGYLWPDQPVRSLLFPKGMALTREFWLRETDSQAADQELLAWDQEPIGIAVPQWWATTDVIIPFAASNPSRFPFIENLLGGTKLLGSMGQESIESIRAYGVFDFGDTHGDGGWLNMESFNDWSALLSGIRSGNEDALRIGLRAARHYRDIDMNQMTGQCYIHSLNHILGGTSFSHSWPEGVMFHYLLTGSKRSYELIQLHGDYILTKASDPGSVASGNRNLGRYLTNTANLYGLTGDPRFRERFFEQLTASQEALEKDPNNPDRSIFSNVENSEHRRLVPFHAWYGITALQHMASLTGNIELQQFIEQEVTATLNPELYYLDLLELWPGVPPQEGMPIIAANFAHQRGSFFYPGLTAAAVASNHSEWARLSLDALYIWAVEGISTNRIQAIVSSPPLNTLPEDITEKDLLQAAADLLWRAAAPTLLNGDFSLSADYPHHWRLFPGKSISHHINWQRLRQNMAILDTQIVHSGERSLKIDLSQRSPVAMDTHRFQIEPGTYQLTGWLRWDEGAVPPDMELQIRNLKGGFHTVSIKLSDKDPSAKSSSKSLQVRSTEFSDSDPNGWRKLSLKFNTPIRLVANLRFAFSLKAKSSEGHVWLDDFSLEKAAN